MRVVSLFSIVAILLLACSCTCTNDNDTNNDYGQNDAEQEVITSRDMTIHYLEEYEGLENPKLIFSKYMLIACVIDTSYSTEYDFDPENPDGFATGQIIDVVVIDDIVGYGGKREGELIEGIYSYGGDTMIVGKPQTGDIVGWRLGYYASIWEKIELAELCQCAPYLE